MFLSKHFDPWLKEHLPYGLFSPEPEVERTVANFILGRPPLWSQEQPPPSTLPPPSTILLTLPNPLFLSHPPPYCVSEYHQKRVVHLCEFEIFLIKRCTTLADIKQTRDITLHYTAIKMIVNGHNLWGMDLPPPLLLMREYYVLTMAAMPTVTHMIERAVKRSNNCNVHSRSEKIPSIYATAYTEMVKRGVPLQQNKINQTIGVRFKNKGVHMINMSSMNIKKLKMPIFHKRQGKALRTG